MQDDKKRRREEGEIIRDYLSYQKSVRLFSNLAPNSNTHVVVQYNFAILCGMLQDLVKIHQLAVRPVILALRQRLSSSSDLEDSTACQLAQHLPPGGREQTEKGESNNHHLLFVPFPLKELNRW